jgi:hypothetical protein
MTLSFSMLLNIVDHPWIDCGISTFRVKHQDVILAKFTRLRQLLPNIRRIVIPYHPGFIAAWARDANLDAIMADYDRFIERLVVESAEVLDGAEVEVVEMGTRKPCLELSSTVTT